MAGSPTAPPVLYGRLRRDISPPDGLIAGAAVKILARLGEDHAGITRNLIAGPDAPYAMRVRLDVIDLDPSLAPGGVDG